MESLNEQSHSVSMTSSTGPSPRARGVTLRWFERLNLFHVHAPLAIVHTANAICFVAMNTNFRRSIFVLQNNTLTLMGTPDVGMFSFVFCLMAALDHLYLAVYYYVGQYNTKAGVVRGPVLSRWAEYCISASMMHAQIFILSGGQDFATLMLLSFVTVLMMICGLVNEDYERGEELHGKIIQSVGWACFVIIYSILFFVFFFSVSKTSPGPPEFVWAIIFILCALEACFGVVAYVYTCADTEAQLFRRELAYGILSLVAKTLLAWITFSGARSRE